MANSEMDQIKSFSWHPYKNEIFYLKGCAFGTPSGGELYSTDIKGNKRLAAWTEHEKVLKIFEFQTEDTGIYFTIARFVEGEIFPLEERLHIRIAYDRLNEGQAITPEMLNIKDL
jgi:hypothetical protein